MGFYHFSEALSYFFCVHPLEHSTQIILQSEGVVGQEKGAYIQSFIPSRNYHDWKSSPCCFIDYKYCFPSNILPLSKRPVLSEAWDFKICSFDYQVVHDR